MGHEQENGIRAYAGGIDRNVIAIHMDGTTSELPTRLDLRNHSPDGFAWGYGGSGPAQLALAILAHFLQDDDKASRLYQYFKWDCIAALPQDETFELEAHVIREWLAKNANVDQFEYVEEAQP